MPQTIQDVRAKYYHSGGEATAAAGHPQLPAAWQETLVFTITTTPTRVLDRVDPAQYTSRVRVIFHNRGSGAVYLGPSNAVSALTRRGIALASGERLIDEWPFVHMGEVWAVSDSTAELAVTVVSAV